MLFIRPKVIDDSVLTMTNVIEIAPPEYDADTTYSAGDLVSVYSGTEAAIYESLEDDNTNNPPGVAPEWQFVGTTYASYASDVQYSSGDRVIDPATHRIYESQDDSNTGNALDDPTYWIDIAPTNRWAMFDSYNSTVTSHPVEIDVSLGLTGRIDALALLNVSNASTVRVVVSTPEEGTLYDETFTMVSAVGVSDWYTYFFEEVIQRSTLYLDGLPVYANPTVRVVITGNGTDDVSCGILLVGRKKEIGATLHQGAQVGMTDYSVKRADDFGNFTIVQRAFAKRGSFRALVPKAAVDGVHQALTDMRATPTVYVASDQYGSTIIFGVFKDFNVEIAYPSHSLCTIELEGLT